MSRRKIFSATEGKAGDADKERPKMMKEGTFTKEVPTDDQTLPEGDKQQQHEDEQQPNDKQVTKIESTHTLLDKVNVFYIFNLTFIYSFCIDRVTVLFSIILFREWVYVRNTWLQYT